MKTSASKMISAVSVGFVATLCALQVANAGDEKGAEAPTAVEYRYIARFQKPVSGQIIAFNMYWQCNKNRCYTRARHLMPLLPVCQEVAQVSGETVSHFLVRKEKARTRLTPSEIRECNT